MIRPGDFVLYKEVIAYVVDVVRDLGQAIIKIAGQDPKTVSLFELKKI